MFQWKLWDDRIEPTIPDLPESTRNSEGVIVPDTNQNNVTKFQSGVSSNLSSLPISLNATLEGFNSRFNFPPITFSTNPKNVAAINMFTKEQTHHLHDRTSALVFRTRDNNIDSAYGDEGVDFNEFPPNRIRVINIDGWTGTGVNIQLAHIDKTHRDSVSAHKHIVSIGLLMFFDNWEECNRPDTINVETVTPQLMGDAETATPIPGVLAGRRKRVSMTWNGVAFDDPELKPLMNLLDELDDRNKPVLFRPSTDRPMYFFGRLERWNYASRGSTDTINATFITDGMGQP